MTSYPKYLYIIYKKKLVQLLSSYGSRGEGRGAMAENGRREKVWCGQYYYV